MGKASDHLYAQVIPKKGSKENPIDLHYIDDAFGAPGSQKRREIMGKQPKSLPIPDVYITKSHPVRRAENTGSSKTQAEAVKSAKANSPSKLAPSTPKKRAKGSGHYDNDGLSSGGSAKRRKAPATPMKQFRPPGKLKYAIRAMDQLMARVTDNRSHDEDYPSEHRGQTSRDGPFRRGFQGCGDCD
ncbi:hypothetical protein F5Y06DRAFT_301319 [Hypoxylon sp. FL0890]|nr:hypothetical protein F5Y06DRAFT_301319 [Hypoxylon sp. FL0890]